MKLYLSSYQLGNDVDEIKKWLRKAKGNKLALVFNAKDGLTDKTELQEKVLKNKTMLEEVGFDVDVLDLKKFFYKKNELKKRAKTFNAFFVAGGNVFVLRKAMELSGFDEFLTENVDNHDILYIGSSAGSCVLTTDMKGLELVDSPINVYNDDEVLYSGVGIIDFCVVPHYKSQHPEAVFIEDVVEYMKKNKRNFKAIHDGEVIKLNF